MLKVKCLGDLYSLKAINLKLIKNIVLTAAAYKLELTTSSDFYVATIISDLIQTFAIILNNRNSKREEMFQHTNFLNDDTFDL